MFVKELRKDFVLKEVTEEVINICHQLHFNEVYKNRANDFYRYSVEETSQLKINERKQADQRYRLNCILYHGSEIAGWHCGYAIDSETYYMQNSAVLEAYRGKGLYTALLEAVLEKLEKEGFQVVTSTHHPNNAAVLIPKIKKGFVISGMHFHERFRSLIELKYIYNQERRKLFHKNLGLEL